MQTQTRVYRLSINGKSAWRPSVTDIRAYSDFKCTKQISTRYVDQSGSNPKGSKEQDGSKAFDDSTETTWRPQCAPNCNVGEAWVMFSTEFDIKCADAQKLGEDGATDKYWNVGIKVERLYQGTWMSIIESNSGNIANGMCQIKVEHRYVCIIRRFPE